jgi:hypothetical protein
MTRIILILCVILTSNMFAQQEENQKVKAAVDTFFEGFHKGDTLLMKSVMTDNLLLQTTFKDQDGKNILVTENRSKLIETIASRPEDQKWDERLLAYNIQIDGSMANVWTPYEFWLNGVFSHCGVNNFQLFNDSGQWKIIYLIDTRRKEGCDPK